MENIVYIVIRDETERIMEPSPYVDYDDAVVDAKSHCFKHHETFIVLEIKSTVKYKPERIIVEETK